MKAGRVHDIEIVAINDLGDAETNARLMRYDTAHERCAGSVAVDDDQLVANGDRLEVFAERNPSVVPRGPLGVDFVLERTSRYTSNKIVSRTSCRRRDAFACGTKALGEAIASSKAFSIAGGGDTLAAISRFGLQKHIGYISTGGGAFLEFLEGKTLPAIAALQAATRARRN